MRHKLFWACAAGIFLCFFSGCAPTLEVAAGSDGGYDVGYAVVLGHSFMEAISAVANVDADLFDTKEIERQFSKSAVPKVSALSPTKNSLLLRAQIEGGGKDIFSRAGVISTGRTKSGSYMELAFSPKALSAVYGDLPENTRAYIDLFMAPAFTGDDISEGEYLEMLSMVYGEKLAQEISSAKMTLVLHSPDKKQKKYTLRLLDLLMLKTEKTFSISW